MGWHQIKPKGCIVDKDGNTGLVCGDQALEIIEHGVDHLSLLWLVEHSKEITVLELNVIFGSVLKTFQDNRNMTDKIVEGEIVLIPDGLNPEETENRDRFILALQQLANIQKCEFDRHKDEYRRGLLNGLRLAISCATDTKPEYEKES